MIKVDEVHRLNWNKDDNYDEWVFTLISQQRTLQTWQTSSQAESINVLSFFSRLIPQANYFSDKLPVAQAWEALDASKQLPNWNSNPR